MARSGDAQNFEDICWTALLAASAVFKLFFLAASSSASFFHMRIFMFSVFISFFETNAGSEH